MPQVPAMRNRWGKGAEFLPGFQEGYLGVHESIATLYFTVIINLKSSNKKVSFCIHVLLALIGENLTYEKKAELKQVIIEGITLAAMDPSRTYFGVKLGGLMKCLAKLAEGEDEFQDILPLLPRFKEILAIQDNSEQRNLTACLKELCRSMQASQRILFDDTFNDMLGQLTTSEDEIISANANSIFWRSGQSTGTLPTKRDIVLSEEFPKKFTIDVSEIGAGSFGSVHLVTDEARPDEKKFVAKKSSLKKRDSFLDMCKKEATILLKVKHRRIVQFHGFKKTEDAFYIFLEFLKNGTLAEFISKRGSLDEKLTRHFTTQILEGIEYLHENSILHRDIKGNNVLMEDDWNLKITDFGLSEFVDANGVSTEIGTVRYMAPEVIYTEGNVIRNYTSRADIWSVGCTAVEMVTGKPPYSSVLTPQIIFHTALGNPLQYHLPESSSVYFKEFLNRILHRDSKLRPTAEWLLKNDPFILGSDGLESLDDIK
ncbi:mitogen-activated protein kinase kinase kinase 2-like [Physella acuta]|uniref:mitogen-activated protein kinase kinase kinase 2-like n=1 Tax=Physella acuta TaxID=109671 RepID=UPI0027DDC9B4|nr:mitogen-activated protein kinase kinase kinase 2-like [Physella acuta]